MNRWMANGGRGGNYLPDDRHSQPFGHLQLPATNYNTNGQIQIALRSNSRLLYPDPIALWCETAAISNPGRDTATPSKDRLLHPAAH